jgi:hypothetical protein
LTLQLALLLVFRLFEILDRNDEGSSGKLIPRPQFEPFDQLRAVLDEDRSSSRDCLGDWKGVRRHGRLDEAARVVSEAVCIGVGGSGGLRVGKGRIGAMGKGVRKRRGKDRRAASSFAVVGGGIMEVVHGRWARETATGLLRARSGRIRVEDQGRRSSGMMLRDSDRTNEL